MHKYVDNQIMNMVNYMSDYRSKDFTFKGFIPAPDTYFGMSIGDENFVAVHLSKTPIKKLISDDKVKERKFIQSGKSWVAMLYGSDNTSYIKRFDSEDRMNKWWSKLKELRQEDSWCFYNS